MKIFDIFAPSLQEYCDKHNLDFNKVKSSPKCGNEMALFVQHVGNSGNGLEMNKPAEILLLAKKDEKGNIQIEKFKGADEHLAVEKAS